MRLEYWHFILDYAIVGGLGGALLMSPAFASVGHFFSRRRGLATGIANTSGSIGGITIPLILQRLIPTVGFPWAVIVIGFVFLVLAIPANLFIKSRLPSTSLRMSFAPDLRPLMRPNFALCTAGTFLMEVSRALQSVGVPLMQPGLQVGTVPSPVLPQPLCGLSWA